MPDFNFNKRSIPQEIFSLKSICQCHLLRPPSIDSEDIRILWQSTVQNHFWEVTVREPNILEIDREFAILLTINKKSKA